MQTQIYDKKSLKMALIELLQSDLAFNQQVIQLLFSANGAKVVTWDSNTYIIAPESKGNFYYEMLPKDRQEKHKELREKYQKNKGIRLKVIEALQAEFDDAPLILTT